MEVYNKNLNKPEQDETVASYVYDSTNRMVKGVNADNEQSFYIFDGFGNLIANEWIIHKNAYGYTGMDAPPSPQVNGAVVCDRHTNTTGGGHINPTGQGHTTGGTAGGVTPVIDGKKFSVVHKDYVLDYTSPLKNILMETEAGAGGLTCRHIYGLDKLHTVINGIPNGVGSVMQYVYNDGEDEFVFSVEHPGQNIATNNIVKLWYHHDRLGSTTHLTDNVAGKAASFVSYDDWGALTAKAVLRMGVRELDLVQEYTVHPADMVLGVYYAKAMMYDAADRRWMSPDLYMGNVFEPLINATW
jgi:hypothetical protein